MVIAAIAAAILPQAPPDYKAWRAQQEASLKQDYGWLSVAGLHWFTKEKNTFGKDPSCDIPLSSGPDFAGHFLVKDGRVFIFPAPAALYKIDGQEIGESRWMTPDVHRADLDSISLMVIKRGERTGVRVFDKNSKARQSFKGMQWYPVDPKLRITAKFIKSPKAITIMNVLGDGRKVESPGYAEFTLNGKVCRLTAEAAGDGFFFNFKDQTNGPQTYAAGRFLSAPKAQDGFVILDFNMATKPPCAFTDVATCPLPPKENRLEVALKAGEKKPLGH